MAGTASNLEPHSGQTLQGVVAGTDVLTSAGALPVEYLSARDRIVTRHGLMRLGAVQMQKIAQLRLIRIATDTLGVGRPETDVLVGEGQLILIRDWRARALFGTDTAMVPAARLADGHLIRAETHRDVRLYTLHFDHAEIIYAGGLQLGCVPQTVSA